MKPIYTQNRYLLDEVISALQKEIRRAHEENAMFWALELVPRYEAYLWRRLCVIVNEDIGLANPLLLLLVPQQRALYMEFREAGKDGSARLVLANTLLLMCRSNKSRLADHFQCVVNQGRLQDGLHLDIPDYARDKHTLKGHSQLKRGVEHWLDVGCELDPPAGPDRYEARARELWQSPNFQQTNWGARKKSGGKGKAAPPSDDEEPEDDSQIGMM